MIGDATIPERDIVDAPAEAGVRHVRRGDNVHEIADDGVAFALGNADDLGYGDRIEEERLPAGDRVGADEWVLGRDAVAAESLVESAGTGGLHVCGMQGSESLEVVLHVGGQGVVDRVLRGPKGVVAATTATITAWRTSEELERGRRWRLEFVCCVRVP